MVFKILGDKIDQSDNSRFSNVHNRFFFLTIVESSFLIAHQTWGVPNRYS
jgi:hypothetical protein